MDKLRLLTLFSGYDSQALAMERMKQSIVGFDYDLVGWCEIDKFAIDAHNAIFPQWADRNIGDITTADYESVSDCDIATWSFPCTDISTAGRQEGLEKDSNTRSSLGWAAIELFRVKKPKILVMENVKALVSGKFMPSFQKMIDALSEIGYYSYFKVLNSKDYGVPQSRERVFMVSVLNDDTKFQFPEPFTLETRVRDLLEDEVDESYMLVDSQINCVLNTFDKDKAQLDGPKIIKLANCFPSGHAAGKVISVNGISPTIMDHHGSVYSVLLKTPVGGEYNIVLDGEYYTLRRLTRRECFRFMDVDDTYIERMQEYGIPKSKQYKLAGNSIVVNVLYHLFKSIVSQYFS